MEDEDFKSVSLPDGKNINIVQFIDLGEIDPIFYEKSYYIAPKKGAEKAYSLLTQVMQLTNRIAIVKIDIKTKQHFCCVKHFQRSPVLETMFYPDEICSSENFTSALAYITIRPNEMKMTRQPVDTMIERFQPAKNQDEYRKP